MLSHLLVSCFLLLSASTLFADGYIVKFKNGSEGFQKARVSRNLRGASVVDAHEPGNLVLIGALRESKKETAKRISELLKNPDVEYVVENARIHAFTMPNDPEAQKQWSIAKVKAAEAWKYGVGSKEVVVAVIDTGVDTNHSDLKDNLWINKKEIPGNQKDDDGNGFVDDVHGYDFAENDADPMDKTSAQNPGHGTHCSGIVGAVGDNGKGISGMSQRVSIMAVRFLDENGSGDLMNAVKAIDYAAANGARIMSASWGAAVPGSQAQPITEAISRANDKRILFIAAASNDGKNNDRFEVYPANTPLPNVITVAASTNADAKPSWSNYGQAKVSLSAPGEEIYSTVPNEKYQNLSGTSMATPLVSGLAALMLSHRSDLNPQEVKALLQASGNKVEIETACNCRVDAAAVVDRIRQTDLTVIPQAVTLSPESTQQFTAWGGKGPYQFSSSSDAIASIDSKGLLTAKSEGEVKITVTDGTGKLNESLRVRVVTPSEGGGGGTECPLGDPAICEVMCQISPDLPWCTKRR